MGYDGCLYAVSTHWSILLFLGFFDKMFLVVFFVGKLGGNASALSAGGLPQEARKE